MISQIGDTKQISLFIGNALHPQTAIIFTTAETDQRGILYAQQHNGCRYQWCLIFRIDHTGLQIEIFRRLGP